MLTPGSLSLASMTVEVAKLADRLEAILLAERFLPQEDLKQVVRDLSIVARMEFLMNAIEQGEVPEDAANEIAAVKEDVLALEHTIAIARRIPGISFRDAMLRSIDARLELLQEIRSAEIGKLILSIVTPVLTAILVKIIL